jgi:hypothetical protein
VLLLTVRSRCAGMTAGLSRRWASVTNSRYVKALTLYREGGKRRNGVVVGWGVGCAVAWASWAAESGGGVSDGPFSLS